jgi:hypothetical protein
MKGQSKTTPAEGEFLPERRQRARGAEGLDARARASGVRPLRLASGGGVRLWVNLYLPSVKRVIKVRVGSKVRRIYDAAQTPLERVLACAPSRSRWQN